MEKHLKLPRKTGDGIMRASYVHGKSCTSAYWDPWGRRILTTSYDDKLRSECLLQTKADVKSGTLHLQLGTRTRHFQAVISNLRQQSLTTVKRVVGYQYYELNGVQTWTTCLILPLATCDARSMSLQLRAKRLWDFGRKGECRLSEVTSD